MCQTMVVLGMLCATLGVSRDTPGRVVQGEIRCRVLLIDFEGREHQHPRESFETIFFGKNVRVTPGPISEPMIGSVRDYFGELSDGRLRVTGEVMPWVRSRLKIEELPHWKKTRDGRNDWWHRVVADAMSLNHIPKDDRINGKPVDFYAIIYAGNDHGYFKCLKQTTFMGAGMRYLSSRDFHKAKVPYWDDRWNGKRITFNPERQKKESSGLYGVGFLFHELGHMMCGFRDLYVPQNGLFGRYAVMAFGEKTHFPTGPIALHRYQAGWLSYDVPDQQGRQRLRLPPLQAKRAVKLVNGPMPWADALIVEHRMRIEPEAKTLPAEGLLVYQAYGHRRVRTVDWDAKKKRAVVTDQNLHLVRADGTFKNEAGDVFRQGELPLFGKASAASTATDCGFWELEHIALPKISDRMSPSARLKQVATFQAVYRPLRITPPGSSGPISLGHRIPPGAHRLYVQTVGGAKVVQDNKTLLEVPGSDDRRPVWGLVDLDVPVKRRPPLMIVPDRGASIKEIQVVPRRPKTLDLLAEPLGGKLAHDLDGRLANDALVAGSIRAGSAIEIPLGKDHPAQVTVPITCPGGVLRLALQACSPRRGPAPDVSLVVYEGKQKQTYLKRLPLDPRRPEFLRIDLDRFRNKPLRLALSFDGPSDSRVVLWEAGFVAR
ncbi:MAG: hypothetical protein JW818_14605 [Pirellulales bacterium]|nr:hypothetical protein [Pirellulales bacterium]